MNLQPLHDPFEIYKQIHFIRSIDMATTDKTRNGEIEARHIEVGDAITFEGAHYMIRDGIPVDADLSEVKFRLSAGRTDDGFWHTFAGTDIVSIYRDGGIPDYAFTRKDEA